MTWKHTACHHCLTTSADNVPRALNNRRTRQIKYFIFKTLKKIAHNIRQYILQKLLSVLTYEVKSSWSDKLIYLNYFELNL